MTYEVVYNLCMIISAVVEIYLAFDFYKTFHPVRTVFRKIWSQIFLTIIKQISKISVEKVSAETFGIMFLIPYIRKVRETV